MERLGALKLSDKPQTHYLRDFVEITKSPGVLCSLCTFAGLFDQWFWPCDLLTHFRVQYLIFLLLIVVPFALAKKWLLLGFFGSAAVVNVILISSLFLPNAIMPLGSAQSSQQLKIMQINLNSKNGEFEKVRHCIEEISPDVICIEEVSAKWQTYFRLNLKNHPYQFVVPKEDNFGIAILSKTPLEKQGTKYFVDGVPTLMADVSVAQEPITIICTHPLPPIDPQLYKLRNDQLDGIASLIKNQKNKVILSGDLNATKWSYAFHHLLDVSGLKDSANGFGFQPTWPTNCFLFWIPIDQIALSKEFDVIERKVLGNDGSDHFPVFTRVSFNVESNN